MERKIAIAIVAIMLIMSTVVCSFAELNITPERTTVVNSLPQVVLYMDTSHDYGANSENTRVLINEEKTDIQSVGTFKDMGEGATYYILIDLSGSIHKDDFESIKSGVKNFVKSLDKKDRIVIVPFGETVYQNDTVYDFSSDEFVKAIDELEANDDYTQLYNAIDYVGDKVSNNKKANLLDRNIAMVFTDGADETTGGYIDDNELTVKMASAGIPLYGFAVGDDYQGKERLGNICRALSGCLTDVNVDNIDTVLSDFKNVIDETLVIKTDVRNSESIGLEFSVRVQIDGNQVLLKEGIRTNKSNESKDVFTVALKKIILEYWWVVLIISIALIALIVLLVIRKNKGIVNVDGKVVYASKLQRKYHIQVKKHNSQSIQLSASVNGGKFVTQEIILVESIIVGRASICDVYFDDSNMSRQHFCIELINGEMYISDLDSTSGTYLDGVRLYTKQRIHRGALITAGRTDIKVDW